MNSRDDRNSLEIGANISALVEGYEQALAQGDSVRVSDFFPESADPCFFTAVCELLRVRVEHEWSRGLTDVLPRIAQEHPELFQCPEVVAPVAFEDFRQARLQGWDRAPDWYAQRWPIDTQHWAEEWRAAEETDAHDSQSGIPVKPGALSPTHETFAARWDQTLPRQPAFVPAAVNGERFPPLGTQLGDFELVQELGRGAFSRVYLTRQRDLANRWVVVKVTTLPLGESQRLARLQHANIMPLYSIHQHQGLYVLCMPWLGSATLKDVRDDLLARTATQTWSSLRGDWVLQTIIGSVPATATTPPIEACGDACRAATEKPPAACSDNAEVSGDDGFAFGGSWPTDLGQLTPVDWREKKYGDLILEFGRRIAQGLRHAHERGILHRDIKPANILLSFAGEPLLMDFNLSREARGEGTATRSIGGTIPYMAPEHVRALWLGEGAVTETADIYSLGVVLYEMLTGRLPHAANHPPAESLAEAWEARQRPVPCPTLINSTITPATAAIVLKCLAVEPGARYQRAADLEEDLQRQLANLPLRHAPNPSWVERGRKFWRRHPVLRQTWVGALLALMSIGVLGSGWWTMAVRWQRQHAWEKWEEFQQAAHAAEAELLFPDGGAYSSGLERAARALALYGGDQPQWQQQPNVTALPVDAQRQLADQVSFLRNLIGQVETPLSPAERLSVVAARDSNQPADSAASELGADLDPLINSSRLYLARHYAAAIEQLSAAVGEQPNRFALWFLLGKCYYELREYRQADYSFARAHQIDPQSALSFLSRALCEFSMRQDDAAWRHLTAAEELDPGIPAVYVNKALVRERQQRWRDALAEIERALQLAPDTPRYLLIRSRLRRKQGDISGAAADLQRLKTTQPHSPEDWLMRGLAFVADDPEQALRDFQEAARSPSQAAIARQNMAHVLSEQLNRPNEALAVLEELLRDEPDFAIGRAGRAVLLARINERAAAEADIKILEAGSLTPQIHYQIGCAWALLAVHDDSLIVKALPHLAQALTPAYGGPQLGSDRDLQALESHPGFQQIKQGTAELMRWRQIP